MTATSPPNCIALGGLPVEGFRLDYLASRPSSSLAMVHVFVNTQVPDQATRVLELRPKVCVEPRLDKVELLSFLRRSAGRAYAEAVGRCVSAGVDLLKITQKKRIMIRFENVAASMREANLYLLVADKEGGFVV